MARGKFTPFTKEEERKIKDEYLDKPIKRLARELGVSYGRIERFLNRNNLVIPREIVEQRKRSSRFKKGHITHNKGLKQTDYMTPEAIDRSKATRFRKGNIPHNISENGSIVSRADKSGRVYKYIRIDKNHWELHHRVVWEKEHGEIPEGYIINFIDGNTENTSIENLKLISMVENMYRNSAHDFPEEIIPSMVLINQLESKLKDLENE